jgi:hypothetical protein
MHVGMIDTKPQRQRLTTQKHTQQPEYYTTKAAEYYTTKAAANSYFVELE